MSREMKKFRAWTDVRKEYAFTGFHIFGEVLSFNMIEQYIDEYWEEYSKHYDSHILATNDFTIEQFTGLQDKNRKDIYEGDILKDDQEYLHQVVFGKLPLDKMGDCVCRYHAYYCKCLGKLGVAPLYGCEEIGSEWMEIIGNIHEKETP